MIILFCSPKEHDPENKDREFHLIIGPNFHIHSLCGRHLYSCTFLCIYSPLTILPSFFYIVMISESLSPIRTSLEFQKSTCFLDIFTQMSCGRDWLVFHQIILFPSFSSLYLQTIFPSLFFSLWVLIKVICTCLGLIHKTYIYLPLSPSLFAYGSLRIQQRNVWPRAWLDHRWKTLKSLNDCVE